MPPPHAPIGTPSGAATDPRPLPPREPQLEDCCGTGCVHCVFDIFQIALDNHERALRAWEARHPDQAGTGTPAAPGGPAPV